MKTFFKISFLLAILFLIFITFFLHNIFYVERPAFSFVKKPIHILFVGDVMLSRQIGKYMNSNESDYPFSLIKNELLSRDFVVGNLESPISDRGVLSGRIYSFRADPEVLAKLARFKFSLFTFANNHVWDYGRDAFLDTMKNLNDFGILYTGAGKDIRESHDFAILSKNKNTVAFLSYTDLAPDFLLKASSTLSVSASRGFLKNDIEKAKAEAPLVVVMFHWGDEYETFHNKKQEEIAHLAIDYGADLVIGHHPHVPQDVEVYKGKNIIYSLGNFIFDQNFSKETGTGLMVDVEILDNKIVTVEQIPISFTRMFEPYVNTKI